MLEALKNIHTLSFAPALLPADHIKIILNGHHLYKEMEDRFDERLPCMLCSKSFTTIRVILSLAVQTRDAWPLEIVLEYYKYIYIYISLQEPPLQAIILVTIFWVDTTIAFAVHIFVLDYL